MKETLKLMLLTVAMMLFGLHARAGSINEKQAKAKALSFLQNRQSSQGSTLLAEVFNSFTAQDKCMAMWGQSAAVELPRFAQPAAVICGKDIVKGIARLLGMDLVRLDGATGDVDTDLDAKTDAALSAAQRYPFVLLHINGADEAAHRRDAAQKNSFISHVDTQVLSRLLQSEHEIIVASDHGADPKNGCHIGTKQPIFVNTRR